MALLATLPSLPLRARYLVEGWLAGRHRSPLKGSSIEFAEYRSYQPGDELRHVDWRLYARSDRLCVKVYEEETQLRVCLVLDGSASMNYRSRAGLLTKRDYARTLLGAIALLVQRQRDAVGLGIAAGGLEGYLRPRGSAGHLREIFDHLDHPHADRRARLAPALQALAEVLGRRALVVVAGDFYEEAGPLESALRRLRYEGHEVLGLQVLDPVEVNFDTEQSGIFTDMETAVGAPLRMSEVRGAYLEQFEAFRAELRDLFGEAGGDFVSLRTDEPPIAALSAYLARRTQMTT